MNTSGTKSIFSFTKRISFSAFFAVNALVAFPVFNALAYEETLPPPPPAVCAAPVDVMLVLDRSGSMAHDEWGFPIYPQPLAAVKSGAVAFVNTLSETNDAVGLVSFSEHATVDSSLGTDFAVVKNQINSLTADGWTNIAEALTKADEEFSLNGRADDTKKVIILLSDGNSNRPLPESAALADALAKAAIAKSHGITIYSIALGEFDETELKSISSGTDFYFHSPTTEELNAIYLAISAKECERIPAVGKGTVFEDLNKNTTRDSGEPGLSGRTIVLKDKKTESPASDRSVTSDSEGKYVFEDIIPGTYDVCANAIADFEQTTPTTSSKCYENMVVNEGDTIENLDFGFSKIHVNTAPIADAGPDRTVTLGDEITFDGSGSTDDGEIVAYDWNFGDESTTTNAATTTVHTYTATSTYTVTLVVTDDEEVASAPDTAIITVVTQCSDGKDNDGDNKIDFPADPGCSSPDDNDERDVNARPIADAGSYGVMTLGDDVIIDGSGSTDDGEIVLYEWNFGDESPLEATSTPRTPHIYTATSTYTITLVVTDNDGATSTPDTATITVATQCSDGKDNDGDHKIDYPTDPGCDSPDDNDEKDVNTRPIAEAGPDRTVTLGDNEIFDGSGSTDKDGEIVLYEWNFGDESPLATTTSSSARHIYTATSTYTIALVVKDNDGATSTPDTARITIVTQCSDGKDNDGDHKIDYPTDPGCSSPDDNDENDVNKRPIADAGRDRVVTLGDDEIFDGSGSIDEDGKVVLYSWDFGDGSTTTIGVATTTHVFTATSTYAVKLVVTDNDGATSTPDTVTVTVAPQCFDGKDNDGDHKIDYPTDPGCRWYDDNDERDVNVRPVADAGPDKIVTLGDAVTLDGSGSTDDKKIVSYEWNFGDGSTTTNAVATTSRTYTATSTYTVTLTVMDDEGAVSDPDTAIITVATQCSDGKDNDGDGKIDYPADPGCDSTDDNDEGDNKLPVAILFANPTSEHINKLISLDGKESYDSDGTIALYEWNFGDGVIATSTTASTTSHAYGTLGAYTATLVVTDNEGATSTPATKTITITTPPPTGCVSNC
ncbi:MAG: PKD domain-containing protein, partial [Candidatus Paceibacterota bacterium]